MSAIEVSQLLRAGLLRGLSIVPRQRRYSYGYTDFAGAERFSLSLSLSLSLYAVVGQFDFGLWHFDRGARSTRPKCGV